MITENMKNAKANNADATSVTLQAIPMGRIRARRLLSAPLPSSPDTGIKLKSERETFEKMKNVTLSSAL